MNKLTIIGNLTADPVSRSVNTANGAANVCTFTVAVNGRKRGDKQDTTFFRVTTWRAIADNCSKWLIKGKKVAVTGPVTVSTYQAQDGTTRASLDVNADDVEFLSPAMQRGEAYDSDVEYKAPQQDGGFTQVEDASLPF